MVRVKEPATAGLMSTQRTATDESGVARELTVTQEVLPPWKDRHLHSIKEKSSGLMVHISCPSVRGSWALHVTMFKHCLKMHQNYL